MLKKSRLLIICITFALLLLGLPQVQAQSNYQRYIWEIGWYVQNPTPAPAELLVRQQLESEIQKLLDFCCTNRPTPRHLGPYYVAQGYLREDLYWLNPAETVLVLAEALPFLPANQQAEVIRYLKFEMTSNVYSPLSFRLEQNQASPLIAATSYRFLGPTLPSDLAPNAFALEGVGVLDAPPENLYAAWAFAHYVSQFETPGDGPPAWQIIDNHWAEIEEIFSDIPTTPRRYWQIMGAIGYARMARQLGQPTAQAEQRALNGLNVGDDYEQFYANMGTDVGCFGNTTHSGWEGTWDYCAFSAVYPQVLTRRGLNGYAGEILANRPSMFAPEIGRFLHDQAQQQVMNHTNAYMQPAGDWYFPFWWENKGTKPWGVTDANTSLDGPGNGENAIMHPSFAWQLFMLRATVFPNQTGDSMRPFLDTPWAVGDNFHLQKLITVLRLYSTTVWAETSPLAGLSYSKQVLPTVAADGETVNYTLRIVRQGTPMTTTTWVTDTLPPLLTYVPNSLSASSGSANYAGGRVTWSGLLSDTNQVVIQYQALINTSMVALLNNTARFYNAVVNDAPVLRTATVIANGEGVHLPIIHE